MTKTITKHVLQGLMISVLLIIMGCGVESISGKKTMEIPKLVSIEIPSGWVLDDSQMCHKGEYNTGMLMKEPLERKEFEDSASQMSSEFGAEILSTSNFTINGHKAIKTHIKMTNGVHSLRVYIHKGDNIISVSFAIESKEMYSKYESALLKSIKTIKIK